MKLICTPPGGGKTTAMIRMSAEAVANGRIVYIVCSSYPVAHKISKRAAKMALDIPFPLTFSEFIAREYRGVRIDGLLIDDADDLLQDMARIPVIAMSITDER